MAADHTWEAENTASTCSIVDESTPLLSASGQANMAENIGISQQTLVSTGGPYGQAKKLPQYVAALAATLGALAAGMVLGWSSPAGAKGENLGRDYGVNVTESEFSWIASIFNLGAGAMCVPIGIIADMIGRRTAMLLMVVPFCVGWLLLIFSNSVVMFCFGRFIAGLCAGAFCVAAPLYTAEIAESEIRGSLGSYFQLMLTIGILLAYGLGSALNNMKTLSIISAIVPLIFFAIFFFMPETPLYHLMKNNEEAARKCMIRLRGEQYNVDAELEAQREGLEEAKQNTVSFLVAIKSKAVKKGFVIAYGLMFFQQLSGVNAIIFFSTNIFQNAGSTIPPDIASIIVATVQVVAVFTSTFVVDRLGRRLLLIASIVTLLLTTLIMGVYFYCTFHNHAFDDIKWFALIPLCVFLFMFNLGFGPLPWMMMAEIFSPGVKGVAASSACLFNWLMSFVVTKFFSDIQNAVYPYGAFWIFSGFCLCGCFFVYFLVPETKGKTLDEIQKELNH